ncbi:MAG TPA: hypothetical protein VK034_03775, partial [Enhygromyxa sp.]|nr:hypothetical protein [Enhygromyxa sp.]
SYAVPVNRSSSLLAGVAASVAVAIVFDRPMPDLAQLGGAILLILASVVLAFGPRVSRPGERLVLFVCSGNNCRSAMAERLAMLEASRRLGESVEQMRARGLVFASAGVSAKVGEAMERPAVDALARAGADISSHRSQMVTPELIARAEVVICLSPEYRDRVIELAPWARARTHLLDPEGRAVDKPADGDFDRFARELLVMIRDRFDRLAIVTG